jgi:site-specific recombinase XerD
VPIPKSRLNADFYKHLAIVGTPEQVRARIEDIASRTQADEIMIATQAFDPAARTANPAAELSLPCYAKRLAERIVCEEDVRRLVETDAKPRDRALLRLRYAAGLRVSEACRLLWRNLRPRGARNSR